MNKLTTLIATSLIGISSVAAAQPAKPGIELDAKASLHVSFGTGSSSGGAVVIHDNRTPQPYARPLLWSKYHWPRRPQPRPAPVVVVPASPWTLIGTVGTGKATLRPAAFGELRFDTLMLDVEGRVQLDKIAIVFGDDQLQVIEYDKVLTDRMPMPVIDLAARNRKIHHMVIYTKDTDSGFIRVLGRRDSHRVGTTPAPSAWTRLGTVSSGNQRLMFDDAARYDLLKLTFNGRVHLNRVKIEFANGEVQVVSFDKRMTGSATINLEGKDRRIAKVTVSTEPQLHGEVTLLAL